MRAAYSSILLANVRGQSLMIWGGGNRMEKILELPSPRKQEY